MENTLLDKIVAHLSIIVTIIVSAFLLSIIFIILGNGHFLFALGATGLLFVSTRAILTKLNN